MADLILANQSANGWNPGNGIGPLGGIDQYFDQSGSPNERNTADGIVMTDAPYSADNTGASESNSAFYDAVTAATTNQVVYFPAGRYLFTGQGYISTKSNVTVRGAGDFTTSISSNTVSTGTKTFTVPSGIPWTTGCGIRIWRRLDPLTYMDGTVLSYSGGTLEVDIDTVVGSGTFSDWKVSITIIVCTGNTAGFLVGSDADYAWGTPNVSIVSPANAGDNTVVVASSTDLSVNQIIRISIKNTDLRADIEAGEMPVYSVSGFPKIRSCSTKITNISGSAPNVTLTIDPPLMFDIPLSKNGTVDRASFKAEYVGIEHLCIHSQDSTTSRGSIWFTQCYSCWAYRVEADAPKNYNISISDSVRCAIVKCSMYFRSGGGTNGAGILMGLVSASLIESNVIVSCYPGIEINNGSIGNGVLNNCLAGNLGGSPSYLNANHGPHNSFNLYEGNIVPFFQSDGYFGSASEDTVFRNWSQGETGSAAQGWVVLNRGSRKYNIVGNVLGNNGFSYGAISYGNPNLGNGSYYGVLSGINQCWLHLEISGVLTDRTTNVEGRVRLDSPYTGGIYAAPFVSDSSVDASGYTWPFTIWWSGTSGYRSNLTRTTISGDYISLASINSANGYELPPTGTRVRVWPGLAGFQELDMNTRITSVESGNYLVSGGGQQNLNGSTLKSSLAYSGTPSWWPGMMTWPAINPASPVFNTDINPAGWNYSYGLWPEDSSGVAPPSAGAQVRTLLAMRRVILMSRRR